MLAGFAWWTPHIAQACSCAGRQLPSEAARQADAIFEGRVVAAPARRTGTYNEVATYEFSVTRQWKGDVGQRVRIKTAKSSAACGRRYYSGEVYLVYASRGEDDGLRDNLCSRTRESRAAAEDFARLGPGKEPLRGKMQSSAQALEPPRIPAPPPDMSGLGNQGKGCRVTTGDPGLPTLLGLLLATIRRRRVRKYM